MRIRDVEHVTLGEIRARVDVPAAIARNREAEAADAAPRDRPWDGANPDPGTWRLEPVMGEFAVLVLVSPFEVEPSEPEDDIRLRCPHYPRYVEWYRAGFVPPAIRTVRHALRGRVVSLDRRRVLAARAAGVASIPAWHSEARPDDLFPWQDKGLGRAWRTDADAAR